MNTQTLGPTRLPVAHRWFLAALAVFFVGLSAHYSLKAVEHRSAVLRWRTQLLQMDSGEDIYERFTYPNPPIMALILSPLTKLPPLTGALGWFYLKVVLTLLALHWVFRMVETADRPFPPWAKALTVLLSLRPVMGDLAHGNVNLFILFLVVAGLYAFHRRLDVLAGLILALAVACKVTPALFIGYFLWKRAWKALAGCALGLALFFWLVPGCLLGWEQNNQMLASWYHQMIKPYVFDGVVTSEHNNQSLPGLVFRLATASPSFSTYVADEYVPTEWHNVVSLDPAVARLLIKGCMALFAGLVVWRCRTPTAERGGWRLAAEFSVVVLGMLLFSERTWKHHCVTLVLPFAVLSYYLVAVRPGPRLRRFLVMCLALVVLLMAATSTSLWTDRLAKLAQVYGAYVWAYLILLASLVVILLRKERATQEGPVAVTPS